MSMELRNVSACPPGQPSEEVLHLISCAIEPSEITLVVGKTGAGKSTLLQLLAGLIEPSTGDITYSGRALWEKKKVAKSLLTNIGYVFQYPEHQLFARSVKAEFVYSLKPYRLPEAEQDARSDAAMAEVGLDTSLYPRTPLTLSGGQKRRVALATTLATQSEWLLLDEPTAGLDSLATQQLVDYLVRVKATTRGSIVISTHDLDTFFPIADKVIVLDGGQVAAVATPSDLCSQSDVLLSAGIGLPACIQVIHDLRAEGIALPWGIWSPGEVADWILQSQTGDGIRALPFDATGYATAMTPSPKVSSNAAIQEPQSESLSSHRYLYNMDARAKWVCYLLLSAGMVMQSRLAGIVGASLVALGILLLAGMCNRRFLRSIRPFLYLMLFSIILSALRFSPDGSTWFSHGIGISLPASWLTFRSLYRLLLVMVLGAVLAWTTTQLSIKRGLEYALSGLKRFRLPVEAFSLGTSLVLRFIPVIGKEFRRFTVIVRSRGKSQSRVGTVRIRDLPALVIPLLLSIFQFGEDLSVAMEARGYAHMGIQRTVVPLPKLKRTDWLAMGACLGLLVVMWVVS